MNKKDFFTLMACNLTTLILLIEHFCGMDLALECMCVWTVISMIIHIFVLRDYVIIHGYVQE
jgi:hypothetical protein